MGAEILAELRSVILAELRSVILAELRSVDLPIWKLFSMSTTLISLLF